MVDSVNMINPVLKEAKTEDISHHQWDMKHFLTFSQLTHAKLKRRNIYFQKTETKTLKLFSRVILFGLCEVTEVHFDPMIKIQ